MRYFIELSYKGTPFKGWQRQKDTLTVQQAVEDALGLYLRHKTDIVGAGRTDTGVHAAYYVAHFDTPLPMDDRNALLYHLNAMLPAEIALRSITPVADDSHARFDALSREYKYRIIFAKNPFLRDTAWRCPYTLDVDMMNIAAGHIIGEHTFTAFSKLHSNNKTDLCRVSNARWTAIGGELVFTIRADRFLRNMVRSVVGSLVDVGRGKITADRFAEILASRDRSLATGSAPAQGLFLTDVTYPVNVFARTTGETAIF